MHDVLDDRDLVPDEAQQLAHSGYPVGDLLPRATRAASDGDYTDLAAIKKELGRLQRDPQWAYQETSDPEQLRALIDQLPAVAVDRDTLFDRIHGAWLGRCVGNTMGKPVEGLTPSEVEIYLKAVGQWPQTGYIPLLDELPAGVSHLHESAPYASAGLFTDVPRDDDIDWTILNLSLLERFGDSIGTTQIATAWLDALPFTQTFTAERAAYRNVIRGVPVEDAAGTDNPYREWIGALIRGDVFGYTHPGDPAAAARLALTDAVFSHVANGIYGEVWAAAVVATSFGTADPAVALRTGLDAIPSASRLAEALRHILDLHEQNVSVTDALGWAHDHLGHYNWVHTINNAAFISIALLWGRNFTDAIAISVAAGNDTDSTAATVGSIYGALHGSAAIPTDLIGTTHVHVRSAVKDFDRVSIRELAERTLSLVTTTEVLA
ncbi:ADP-ribosylglycohydrolase family protein [Frondihabitans australicus]|uniref:ADP-ribosylglycohydrolase n=1 Tax=Frondihabitans australicus TaxID=386892 RepID=A0A495IIQ7_9MICO|nr:ADP-ribosylglycohydrolase family protein [Frondihabitans australicus]RKR75867.1 ADP-ribosylglycohydrolase [Frondihabitans australicus]